MLNRSASLPMSTSVLKALPSKLDIKRHSPSILYLLDFFSFIASFIFEPTGTCTIYGWCSLCYFMAQSGARGQHLGHLLKYFYYFLNLCRYLTNTLLESIHLRNKFDFWNVHGIMNTSGLWQSK